MKRLILLVAILLPPSVLADLTEKIFLREYWGVRRTQDFTSGGIPLPKGLVSDPAYISLSDPSGSAVPFQSRPLMRWPDGTLRWVLLTFPADAAANSVTEYRLNLHRSSTAPQPTYAQGQITVTEDASSVTVSTGKLTFSIRKTGGFNLFDRVLIDADNDGNVNDEIVSSSNANGCRIQDHWDSLYTSAADPAVKVKVEEAGPLRAIIKITGNHSNGKGDHRFYGYLCRIYAYAGKPYVNVQYSVKNSYYKARGALAFNGISLDLHPNLTGSKTVTFYDDSLRSAALNDSAYVYQPWPFGFETQVNGTRLHSVDTSDHRARTLGWMDLSDSRWGVSVGLYEFASQTPKELHAKADGSLEARLWPRRYPQGADSANYARGSGWNKSETDRYYIGMAEHKTHQLCYHFHRNGAAAAGTPSVMAAFNHRIQPEMDRRWVSLSRAVLNEIWPDSTPVPDPANLAFHLPIINPPLGDPAYTGAKGMENYYDTWINFGEAHWRNETNSTEYYENQGTRYLRRHDPRTLRILESFAWLLADYRRTHVDSMVGYDLRQSQHFWLRDSAIKRDPVHSAPLPDGPFNVGYFRIWIAPTPGNQTEHYTARDLFTYYLVSGDLKIRDALYEFVESQPHCKTWKWTSAGQGFMSRGDNATWSGYIMAALIENMSDTVNHKPLQKYFQDQLHAWTQGSGTKRGIMASLEPSGAWHTSWQSTTATDSVFGPHNFVEALVDYGFSWYAENYWNDTLTHYFNRRVTCYKDSVFNANCGILYHGWGYEDTAQTPSGTKASNYRIPGSLARLFYFTGDTVFERKMNTFAMDGTNGIFRSWDHGYFGKWDLTVFQPYLFYLNNKADYRKNPIITWDDDPIASESPLQSRASGRLILSPNPFNPAVRVRFTGTLGLAPDAAVRLSLFSPDGRLTASLTASGRELERGVVWNGRDRSGREAASGLYLVRLEAKGRVFTERAALLK